MNATKLIVLGTLVTVLGGLPTASRAVDLVNEDQKTYPVTIEIYDDVRKFRLRPGETVPDVCVECSISIPDAGQIDTDPGDVIIIRDGDFVVHVPS